MDNKIEVLIDKYGLTHLKEELINTVFPCVKVVPEQQETVAIGSSKMGELLIYRIHLNIQCIKEIRYILSRNLI